MIVTRHAAARSARAVNRRGFTLMEVMVVAAILVILAGVGSVALFRYLDEAKESAARTQCYTVEKAVMTYKTTKGQFPDNLQVLTQREGNKDAYLEEKDIIDPWGNPLQYEPGNVNATGKPRVAVANPPSGVPISNWDR